MGDVLKGPGFVPVYVVDILIYSKTLDEHIDHLLIVLYRIKKHKRKLKIPKVDFVKTEINLLEHVL